MNGNADSEALKKKWEEFMARHRAILSYEEWDKVNSEGVAADKAQAQREQEGQMQGEAIEEPNAKCNFCYADLSIIENMLYGNRCVFCAPSQGGESLPLKNIWLWEYLQLCYWDWRIYQEIIRLWKAQGKEDAMMLLLGCLAEQGFMGIGQVKTRREKKRLCWGLKSVARGKEREANGKDKRQPRQAMGYGG